MVELVLAAAVLGAAASALVAELPVVVSLWLTTRLVWRSVVELVRAAMVAGAVALMAELSVDVAPGALWNSAVLSTWRVPVPVVCGRLHCAESAAASPSAASRPTKLVAVEDSQQVLDLRRGIADSRNIDGCLS